MRSPGATERLRLQAVDNGIGPEGQRQSGSGHEQPHNIGNSETLQHFVFQPNRYGVWPPERALCRFISAESRRDFIVNRESPPGLATAKTIDERPICWEHVWDLSRQITDALTPSAIAGNNGSRWTFEYCKLLLPGDDLSMEALL